MCYDSKRPLYIRKNCIETKLYICFPKNHKSAWKDMVCSFYEIRLQATYIINNFFTWIFNWNPVIPVKCLRALKLNFKSKTENLTAPLVYDGSIYEFKKIGLYRIAIKPPCTSEYIQHQIVIQRPIYEYNKYYSQNFTQDEISTQVHSKNKREKQENQKAKIK